MKEKVVGVSLTFRPDLDAVFRSIIDEHRPRAAFHSFISQNAVLLRHLFDRSETHNIRSLRRAMAALAVVFDALHAGRLDPRAVAIQLVYAVAPVVFDLHRQGADPAKLRKILGMEHMAVAGLRFSRRGSEKTDEEKYAEEFGGRYLRDLGPSEWGDAVGCPPICEFLLTGILDRPALVSWAEKLTKPPDAKAERIKRVLCAPREMEDEEFSRTAAQVLNEVEAGEISPIGTYVGLYDTFERCADEGLIAMTRQGVLAKFNTGLSKAEQTGRLEPNHMLRDGLDHFTFATKTDEGRTFRQLVREANESLLARGRIERVRAATSRLKEDAPGFIDALAGEGESGLLFTPVFQELDANDTVAWILALPNSLKVRFEMAVQARYERHNLPAEFAAELPVLMGIGDELKRHREPYPRGSEPLPMSLLVVQGIVGVLDQAIERLRQLKQQKDAPASGSVEAQPRTEQSGNDKNSAETRSLG